MTITLITPTPISRVSCWRRKLWRPSEVQSNRRREPKCDTNIWGGGILREKGR
jgi:hypothetical protein